MSTAQPTGLPADSRSQQFVSLPCWRFTVPQDSVLEVRPAGPEDAEAIWHITSEAYREHRGQLDPPNGSDIETPEDVRLQIVQNGALIALLNGVPAASLRITHELGFLYIGRVGTTPNFRRCGVGAKLMRCAHAAAHLLGYTQVRLGTRAHLPANIAFYSALGYFVTLRHRHPRGSDEVVHFARAVSAADAALLQQYRVTDEQA